MSLLRPPAGSFDRVRWYCLLACLVNVVGLVVALGWQSDVPIWKIGIEETAVVSVWWFLRRGYQRSAFPIHETLFMATWVFVCAWLYADRSILLGLIFMCVCLVALEQRGPRVVWPTLFLAAAYAAAVALTSHSVADWSLSTRALAGLPLASGAFFAFGRVLRRLEGAVALAQALSEASATLVAASGRDEVQLAAVQGGRALVAESPAYTSLWLGYGDRCILVAAAGEGCSVPVGVQTTLSDLPSLLARRDQSSPGSDSMAEGHRPHAGALPVAPSAGTVRIFPLWPDGGRFGALAVGTSEPLSDESGRVLTAFTRQVALAIESATLVEQVRGSEAWFRSIVQNTWDIIVIVDEVGRVRYASPSVDRLFGISDRDAVGRRLADLLQAEDRGALEDVLAHMLGHESESPRFELRLRRPDGDLRHVETRVTNLLRDPSVHGIVLVIHDITDRKTLETRLEHQAFHDPLTGLANRALFQDRLKHALARAARTRDPVAVLFIDLDEFKTINDTFGHAAGDQALVTVSERLQSCLREADTAARLGGDEMAALLEGTGQVADVTVVVQRILSSISAPIRIQGREVIVSASIGVAMSAPGAENIEELLASADLAMYEAKRRGKNCYVVADPEARARILQRIELEADLPNAIDRGELSLVYQPVVALSDGQVVGVEACTQWNHPRRGLLLCHDIAPAAEAAGVAHLLARWELTAACHQMTRWHEQFPGVPLTVSLKLSMKQVRRVGFVEDVASILEESKLRPGGLVIELAESGGAREIEGVRAPLEGLKRLGVRVAIDGFATGRSSLAALPQLPVDLLKIDKAFVDGVGGVGTEAMAFAIATLGQIFHIRVVADGVEFQEQVGALQHLGCDLGMGPFFSAPVDADEMTSILSVPRLPREATSDKATIPRILHA